MNKIISDPTKGIDLNLLSKYTVILTDVYIRLMRDVHLQHITIEKKEKND